jgi:hypothetical protein
MHAACILKTNYAIVIRASFLVRNIVLNTCNSSLHGVIYASMSSGGVLLTVENEMFVCIAPCRELET